MIKHSVPRALLLGIALAAAPVAVAADLKIGYVNTERVMRESRAAQQMQKGLEAEFQKRDKEIAAGPAADMERRRSLLIEDMNLRRENAVKQFIDKANGVIRRIAEAEKFDIVFLNAAYANNRGISVPVNTVKNVVSKLMHDGKIKRAYMGITGDSISLPEHLASQPEVSQRGGLIIYSVDQDSAAKKAGTAIGDVIVKLDGKPVESLMDLRELLDDKAIGKQVKLSVLRGEKITELTIAPTEAED